MSDIEIQNLIRMWDKIAPTEPNSYDCRCKEQRNWNLTHFDAVINGCIIVDMVELNEGLDTEYREWPKEVDYANHLMEVDKWGIN